MYNLNKICYESKLLTLLAIIFLLGNVSSAQGVGAYKAKKTEVVKVKNNNLAPQRQGTFIMPKVGVGYDVLEECFVFNLQAVFGYEFNNHFAIGVGTGFNNYIVDDLVASVPLHLNIHGDFTKHKTTAYYSLDFGVHIPIITDGGRYYIKALFVSPEIGIRFNNCYLGANLVHAKLYEYEYRDCYGDYDLDIDDLLTLSLKFGYKIPLNLKR